MPHLCKPASALLILVLLTARSSIAATSTGNAPLALSYKSAYESIAARSAVVGNYTINGISKFGAARRVTMTLSASGDISFSNWGACSPTGTVSPRSSGRNVFNLFISFKGACSLAEGTLVNGVLFVDKPASPRAGLCVGANRHQRRWVFCS